jgi:hypothetical protein
MRMLRELDFLFWLALFALALWIVASAISPLLLTFGIFILPAAWETLPREWRKAQQRAEEPRHE